VSDSMVGTEDELRWALQGGDHDAIAEKITSENVNVSVGGRSPLHHLADYGHTQMVKYVLSIGANVNAVDKHGLTPLTCAVFENHPEIVCVLISHGADVTVKSPDGTPLVDCAESDEMKKLLA
ncbi:hypothetical protein PENTCL1PPCAC_28402, partial [Pristionchus entomophagus]